MADQPYWMRHSITCTPGCEGDWECKGCPCHPEPDHSWGCHDRCRDAYCQCIHHQLTLFDEEVEP